MSGEFKYRLIGVPRADHRQTSRIEKRGIATPIEHRRSGVLQALIQSTRILGIVSAHHPDRPCLPSIDRLAKQKPTSQKALEAVTDD